MKFLVEYKLNGSIVVEAEDEPAAMRAVEDMSELDLIDNVGDVIVENTTIVHPRKATNIQWDIDEEDDDLELPIEVEIPDDMYDEDEISDYLSDVVGFCHKGFKIVEDE
jgi:vacuolar-type H+-ATPase subunit F/Vma7